MAGMVVGKLVGQLQAERPGRKQSLLAEGLVGEVVAVVNLKLRLLNWSHSFLEANCSSFEQ